MDRRGEAGSEDVEPSERQVTANWMSQHPKYRELMDLDVGDSAQVYAAFLVYLDLTEVRQWSEVTSRGSDELELVLLEGREREGEPVQVVLPLPVHRTLCHRRMRALFRERPGDGPASAAVLLCAVASDSSLVYQRLCPGLVTPDPPVENEDQGRRQHRKRKLR